MSISCISNFFLKVGEKATFLVNHLISRIKECWEHRQQADLIAQTKICHGTTFSTLYLIGKQKGEDIHCLMPFGELAKKKIPVFSGECTRGIMDTGVNQKYTSWVLANKADLAIHYSKTFPFKPESIYERFYNIIKETRQALDTKQSFREIPYAIETESMYWNQILLWIRQIKAWDEERFQKEFKPGLLIWIEQVISNFPLYKVWCREDRWETAFAKMKIVQQELVGTTAYTLSAEDRAAIAKNIPIVFVGNSEDVIWNSRYEERLVQQKMKLGREIRIIATEPSAIPEVENYLKQKHLAWKVSVISLQKLKEISNKIAKSDDR